MIRAPVGGWSKRHRLPSCRLFANALRCPPREEILPHDALRRLPAEGWLCRLGPVPYGGQERSRIAEVEAPKHFAGDVPRSAECRVAHCRQRVCDPGQLRYLPSAVEPERLQQSRLGLRQDCDGERPGCGHQFSRVVRLRKHHQQPRPLGHNRSAEDRNANLRVWPLRPAAPDRAQRRPEVRKYADALFAHGRTVNRL